MVSLTVCIAPCGVGDTVSFFICSICISERAAKAFDQAGAFVVSGRDYLECVQKGVCQQLHLFRVPEYDFLCGGGNHGEHYCNFRGRIRIVTETADAPAFFYLDDYFHHVF